MTAKKLDASDLYEEIRSNADSAKAICALAVNMEHHWDEVPTGTLQVSMWTVVQMMDAIIERADKLHAMGVFSKKDSKEASHGRT